MDYNSYKPPQDNAEYFAKIPRENGSSGSSVSVYRIQLTHIHFKIHG